MIDKPVEVQLQADMLGKMWVVFGPVPATQDSLTIQQRRTTSAIPESVNIGDKSYWGQVVSVPDGRLNLGALFKIGLTEENPPYHVGDRAYLMAEVFCAETTDLLVGTGADWWMKWWIDGLPVFDTLAGGNQSREFSCFDHAFKLHLEPGEHQVCVEVRSGSTGWMLASTADPRYLAQLEEVCRASEAAHLAEEQKREAFLRQAKNASRMKLVVFGSSVAYGAGADNFLGWANQLGQILESRNWTFVNQSVGGDTTEKLMARFEDDLLSQHPNIVILALSLANEGLLANPPAVYEQYVRNMRKLIQMCRSHGIIPVVSNCYPNNGYGGEHLAYVRAFNAELNRWPVASIDLMGTVDNGWGRWPEGYFQDAGHPNSRGHFEMLHASAPSLFDNLIDPLYSLPSPLPLWARTTDRTKESGPLLEHRPENPLRALTCVYAVVLEVNTHSSSVVFSAIGDCSIGLDQAGTFVCTLPGGQVLNTGVRMKVHRPYQVGITYSAVRQRITCFIDGVEVAQASGTIIPNSFTLGGGLDVGAPAARYKDYVIYRSCLDAASLASLASGRWLRSSLHLLAPLDDTAWQIGIPVANYAQTGERLIPRGDAKPFPQQAVNLEG